jgi:hypothetical protein
MNIHVEIKLKGSDLYFLKQAQVKIWLIDLIVYFLTSSGKYFMHIQEREQVQNVHK